MSISLPFSVILPSFSGSEAAPLTPEDLDALGYSAASSLTAASLAAASFADSLAAPTSASPGTDDPGADDPGTDDPGADDPGTGESAPLQPVYLCGATTSSMDVARALIQGKENAKALSLPPWGSVLASCQTSGKGQLGRAWLSPLGNIYAALRLPALPPFTSTAAAPAVGGLVAQALTDLGYAVRMKWPNDIVTFSDKADWRKIGGILLEERDGAVIAGIGINLRSSPPDSLLRADHALPAGTLGQALRRHPEKLSSPPELALSPLPLWIRLANLMLMHYNAWSDPAHGEHWRELAERHLAFRGRTVLLVDGEDGAASPPAPGTETDTAAGHLPEIPHYQGILDGLDESGGLRLSRFDPRLGLRSEVFLSGSLRLPAKDDAAFPLV